MEETITAIATPPGRGAIGVIRISGSRAKEILGRVWKSRAHPVENFITHRLYLGNIVDLSTGETVDQVMAALMQGPHSYTAEDVVEISCHGGPQTIKAILNQIVKAGARMAEPGEFTKRAFLNGKIDLAQAEAVAQLIDARSVRAARMAEEQLEGKLSKKIQDLQSNLKELTAYVEASIDFPEEDERFIEEGEIGKRIGSLQQTITHLIESYDEGRILREGVKTVIAGPPNAGKSSLLNAILGTERAIVHHIPGTTRDTIEEGVTIRGIPFRMIDTAGIREAEEEVEEIGVGRSRHALTQAEVVIVVLDGHNYQATNDRFVEELRDVKHVIVAINKMDLKEKIDSKRIRERFAGRTIVKVSAKNGDGIDNLLEKIADEIVSDHAANEEEDVVITSERHFGLLVRSAEALVSAGKEIDNNASPEFIAIHLKEALGQLGRIVGEVTTDDLLNEIFSRFCIGK